MASLLHALLHRSRRPHQPVGRTPIRRTLICHSAPRIRDQRIWPRGITVGTIANIAHCPRWRETGRVDVTDLDVDPLRQLATWLDAARAAGQPMPETMTIASATSDAIPSARLVVLRGLRRGLVFFTDCESDKGAELAANPRAAAVLHWLVPAHRQVRVAGLVERVSENEANEYWSTRPRRPPQRGRLAPKPRRRQPGGPGNAGPGQPAAPPRRSRCSPSAALGRLPGAAHPRRVLAGITGRPARPDPLPPPKRRLDHRAAVAITIRRLEIPNLTVDGGEERRDVAGYELWLLGGGKWPAPGHQAPASDVVQALGPFSGRLALGNEHVREGRDPDPMSQMAVRNERALTRDNGPLSLLQTARHTCAVCDGP